jgi:hypothetical protein
VPTSPASTFRSDHFEVVLGESFLVAEVAPSNDIPVPLKPAWSDEAMGSRECGQVCAFHAFSQLFAPHHGFRSCDPGNRLMGLDPA